uniref:Venom protein n=1 Tax=Haemonchus contortus TaxID=6289 RepID=A0A7I4YQ26_HAECO
MITTALLLMAMLQPTHCELIFVLALWTTGERGLNEAPYPNDLNDPDHWSRGEGLLTEIGLKRMLELGKWLRQRYMIDTPLLSKTYSIHELIVQSAGVPHTIESAQAVVAGLYSDEGNGKWSNYSLGSWQPTPVFTAQPWTPDPHLLQPSYPCPAYRQLIEEENKNYYERFDEESKEWYKVLERHTGIIPVNRVAIFKLHGIHHEIAHGQPQPDWINEVHNGTTAVEWLRDAHRELAHALFNSKSKARLTAGVLLNDWIEALIGISHHTLEAKRAIFSSSGIPSMLAMKYAMGIADQEAPGYGSLLLVELHRPNGWNLFVKLYTRNSTGYLFQHKLPDCEHNCPLDRFITELRPMRLTVQDFELMCKSAPRSSSYDGRAALTMIAFLTILIKVI